MIYRFVDDHHREYPVTRLCRTLGVSPSGYYAWRQRPPSARAEANQRLVTHMRLIHREVDETYGSPRMHAELVARGLPCNVKRVARLMRLHHLRASQTPLSRDDEGQSETPGRAQSPGATLSSQCAQ